MKSSWRYLGFPVGGAALTIAGAISLKTDVLHYVLGLPESVVVLDSATLWLVAAGASLVFSMVAVGSQVMVLTKKDRSNAVEDAERKIAAANEERDNWKRNYEGLQKSTLEYAADRDKHKMELAALKANMEQRGIEP